MSWQLNMDTSDFFELLFESSKYEGIICMDLNGIIMNANAASEKITGYNKEELRGANFEILFTTDDRLAKKPEAELRKVLSSGAANDENYLRQRSGESIWVAGESILIKSNGSRYVLKSIFNINRQKELEKELLKKVDQLKERSKQTLDFIGFVTHELRTPLTVIKSYRFLLENALRHGKTGPAIEYFKKIETYIDGISSLVTDLHDLSKADLGKFQIHAEPLNCDELVKDVVETNNQVYMSHKIEMKGKSGAKVMADRYRIKQVLNNYISNAVKYSPEAKRVIVQVKADKERAVISVRDFGLGIPGRKMKKLFMKLYRAHKNTHIEGLGLGLYLSKEIINAHGGEVWAESTEGEGSTFYFSLPVSNE